MRIEGRAEKEERRKEKEAWVWGGSAQGPKLEELLWLFQASGLWLQALANHRGQCEAGLFGDVFSAGPVCLFSAFLALSMSGVEEEEDRGVADQH